MKEIKRVVEIKTGRIWETSYISTDPAYVFESLSKDLISKKINACTYIRNIKRTQNYNGTITITVNYDNNTRSVYTIPE
jgi:hypothetical protein